jgi:imidazolonepropionase-like amidohydrolase
MNRRRVSPLVLPLFIVWAALAPISSRAAVETTVPPAGLREHTPTVTALTNARIVLGPGRVVRRGTLVIREGVIADVGPDATPPADAVVRDMKGLTLYPGFIDAYAEVGVRAKAQEDAARKGSAYWNPWVTPQLSVGREFSPDTATARKLRSQGFTTIVAAPPPGIIRGMSAVVSLGTGDPTELVIQRGTALHVALKPATTEEGGGYPDSPMGAYTLVRQALLDADWYVAAQAEWARHPELPRPETNDALAALSDPVSMRRPLVIDAPDELYALRADRLAREFGRVAILRGSGREYRMLDAIRATGRGVILPLDFPGAPPVTNPDEAVNVSLEELMHWDLAPENPARLVRAGVPIAFTAEGLPDSITFLDSVRKAVHRGLDKEAALRALTVTPATMFGLERRLGTLDSGRAANLVVADGDIFARKTKVREVWVDGRRFDVIPPVSSDPRGAWNVQVDAGSAPRDAIPARSGLLTIEGEPGAITGSISLGRGARLKAAEMLEARLSFTFASDSLGVKGVTRMSGTVTESDIVGTGVWPGGSEFTWSARRARAYLAPSDTTRPEPLVTASFPVTHPLGEFGRVAPPAQPAAVLFREATVWTSGPAGVIEHGSVLVERGRIAAVGRGLKAPRGAQVVECAGRHLTPGIIDCHSHTASDGGINEAGQTVTAEVRIGDFIDPNDIDIYRELAGGVTAAHVLHGSANVIGGQNQLIKMRWGADPEAMKFAGAPPTIKFALGENVKQSNWGDKYTSRYPQTRMGVEQLLRDEFAAARDYQASWREWKGSKKGIPPRRDLELEAIAEVLDGTRRIHCHSYRQDEILMLMRVCDEFGVRNVTHQHVLEGYKVADEMARRGDGASTFSDWWAYKMEVYDAIPYNGLLMQDAGVVVSFNSDSNELARRLNAEAGKARKYGAMPDADALKLVTLNPARQLGVADKVGTIEVGKDADLALWNGPPLSTYSRCEQTWVDGRKYFDRDEDRAERERGKSMRAALIQKALRGTN